MKKLFIYLLIFQTAFGPFAYSETKPSAEVPVKEIKGKEMSLTLPVGVSRTLEFPFEIGPINVTDPTLFDFTRVREGDKETKLLLVPKNAGYTDLTIHDSTGKPMITYLVRVTREDLGEVMAQLEELLGDIEGLKIRSIGGTIILDGEILLPKDMIRIIRVLDAVRDRDPKRKEVPIRNLATISKITMNILAERIEREIGSPEIQVKVINNNLFLEGTADSNPEADRAYDIAKTYLPEVVVEKTQGDGVSVRPKAQGGVGGGLPGIVDLLKVRPKQPPAPKQDIKITMNYVELKNDYDKLFNFSWKPLLADTGTAKYDSSLGELSANVVATVSSLLPKLNNLKSHGHARILKTQQLLIKDGADTPGVIESSLDFYTRVVNEKGEGSLQAIPVQNFVKVKGAILGTDTIDVGIQISLNTLVGQASGTPQIAKNSIQTQVIIKNGDSAALGGYGIDQAIAGYNRDDAPSTGQGSPAFNLSRSKSFNRLKQQYIIFITPEILRTASAGTEDMTRKFRLNAGESK